LKGLTNIERGEMVVFFGYPYLKKIGQVGKYIQKWAVDQVGITRAYTIS